MFQNYCQEYHQYTCFWSHIRRMTLKCYIGALFFSLTSRIKEIVEKGIPPYLSLHLCNKLGYICTCTCCHSCKQHSIVVEFIGLPIVETLDVFWPLWRASSSSKFVAYKSDKNCISTPALMWQNDSHVIFQ